MSSATRPAKVTGKRGRRSDDEEPTTLTASDDADVIIDDDSEFIMKPLAPPSSTKPKPSKKAPVTAPSSPPSPPDDMAGFLSGLTAPALPAPPLSLAASIRQDGPSMQYGRVQDRLAMKAFYAQQMRERAGLPALSEAEAKVAEEDDVDDSDAADDDDDDEEGDEDEAGEQSSDGAVEASASKEPRPPRPPPPPRAVHVVEWQGNVEELRRVSDFTGLKLSKPLIRAITDLGWSAPTPVQSGVIPYALSGRDVLANAATGSGKTGAFMLPILERLLYRPNRRVPLSRVLVLLPTRELARQCLDMTEALARHTDIRAALIVGGLSAQAQEAALRSRPDILLATPGRLIDHLRNSPSVHLEDVEVLVLDEADRLLELGFLDEVREVVRMCPRQRQTLLFSATLSASVSDLILLSCKDPIRVTIDPYDAVVARLTQEFIRIPQRGSVEEEEREREAVLIALCKRSFTQRVLLFTRTRDECHRLCLLLSFHQVKAAELQGNLTQQQRMEALDLFSQGKVSHLVCTDLASRGLDIPSISTVIQSSMPQQLRLYIHRVGRTARAGKGGRAVTLVGFHERKSLKALMQKSNDLVHARQVPTDVVDTYRQSIAAVEEDVTAVLAQEKEDKAHRVAEMEVNKARNQLVHEREILSRPAKTWFQTQQDKLNSKAVSVQMFPKRGEGGGDEEEGERGGGQGEEEEEEGEEGEEGAGRASKAKKDPLRGLSRAQKRRKLMRMEAEREAKQRLRQAREADPSVSRDDIRVIDPVDNAVKSAKAAKRKQLKAKQSAAGGGERGGEGGQAKAQKKAAPKRRSSGGDDEGGERPAKRRVVLMDAAPVDRRYKVRKTESRAAAPKSSKPKPAKGRKAFKSKGKHKRR